MSKQSKSTLKSYFRTGCLPTQHNFEELIDSMNNSESGVGVVLKPSTDNADGVKVSLNESVVNINISNQLGKTYESIEDASNALSKLTSNSPKDGMKLTYTDSVGRLWEYSRMNGKWILSGNRGIMDFSDNLNDGYISSSNGNVSVNDRYEVEDLEGNLSLKYHYGVTSFIELHPLESIYYEGKIESYISAIYCYGSDYRHLGSLLHNSGTHKRYFSAEEIKSKYPDTKYVRMCADLREGNSHVFRLETDQANERNIQLLGELTKEMKNLKLISTSGFTGFWDDESLDPSMESSVGDKSILDDYGFFLVKEDGANTKVIGELKKNNFLRFKDGSVAPVIVATHEELVPDAPKYLTEDKGYGIVKAWKGTKYILNGTGLDHRLMFGIYNGPTTINGVTARMMEMTGICADLPTKYNGELRCIPFSPGMSATMDTGVSGSYGIKQFLNGYYPTHGVNQGTCTKDSRAKNKNRENPLDKSLFSEQMAFHKLSHIYASYLKYGTYYLHNPKLFGRGISSTAIGTDELSFKDSGGVRWKVGNGGWSYGSYGTVPKDFYMDAGTPNTSNWSSILNSYGPKLQTLEAQMALSYAVENSLPEDQTFVFNGGSYYYRNVSNTKGIMEGEMNARLYKDINFTFESKDVAGSPITVTVNVILQVGVVDGYISWGGVFDYGLGGLEAIAVPTNTAYDPTRNLDVYLCTLQHQLSDTVPNRYNNDVSDKPFDFMSTYEHMGQSEIHNHSEGYAAKLIPFSIIPMKHGGSLSTGACAYSWKSRDYFWQQTTYNTPEERMGKYFRLGICSRCNDYTSDASSRHWFGNYLASTSYYYYASAYQLRLQGLVGVEKISE